MKKQILIFLICSLLLLSLVSCTPDSKQNEETPPDTTTDTIESTTPVPIPDETTTPDDTTIVTPPERVDIPLDEVFAHETFTAELFMQDASNLSNPTAISVWATSWEIRFANISYKSAKIVNNPTIIYPQKILPNTNKSTDEVYDILTKIQNSQTCCMLETNEMSQYGKNLAVYNIDDIYYIVIFSQNGKVMAIYHTDDTPEFDGELKKDSALVTALNNYFESYLSGDGGISQRTFVKKIDSVKNTQTNRPIHVNFAPSDYYFVCGYYTPTVEHSEDRYCCFKNYTWIRYENENEIQQYCGNMTFVVSFQINKASQVDDIFIRETPLPSVEYFAPYQPRFESGKNTNPPVLFDQTFIYLSKPNKDAIYIYESTYHQNFTLPCVRIDDQTYISVYLYTIDNNGTPNIEGGLTNDYFKTEFGEYYDILVSLMDTQKYSVTNGAYTHCYGVISLDDFINSVVQ